MDCLLTRQTNFNILWRKIRSGGNQKIVLENLEKSGRIWAVKMWQPWYYAWLKWNGGILYIGLELVENFIRIVSFPAAFPSFSPFE